MDCMEGLQTLPANSVDCIITDPPYTNPVSTSYATPAFGSSKNYADLTVQEFYFRALKDEISRVLKPNGRVFIFCDDKYYPILFKVFYEWSNSALIIWDKGRINMGVPFRKSHELIYYACRESYQPKNKGMPTIIKFQPLGTDRIHAAQKPIELVRFLVENFTEQGDVICDLFLGSGTTALAAKLAGRKYIGFELNEDYYNMSLQRLGQESLLEVRE